MQDTPSIKPELVREIVLVAHGDFNRVKELLEQEPGLLNAAWDWGSGDWETPMGSAGHMGRRDIAEYLLERGARMDLFAAAMLGNLAVVKGTLEANPSLKNSKGPHGIPLIAHAAAGGEEAKPVLEYLQSLENS
jgi:hypothetical protein